MAVEAGRAVAGVKITPLAIPEPVLAGGERNEDQRAEPELDTGAANELRPARFSVETEDQRLLVHPDPPGRILVNRHQKTCDHRIAWLIENMPLHGAVVVQYQPEMIEADDPS